MKTKNRNFLISVVLMGIATMMTACADNDLASQTPIGGKIVGKWYAETPKQVTLGTGEKAVECAKVVLVGSFDADGDGFWSYILVDKQNRAIQPVGKDGKEHPYYANCQYGVTGNTVDVELTANYLPTSQMEWTFKYNGTCLQTKYEDRLIVLHPITTSEDAMYQEWMQQLGFGASADNYNINDKDITAQNWRQTEAIYVYDGVGADVTDEKGRTGYTTVNLPWYEGGVVDSNLDPAFCDDITPENGWVWVLNLCGNRSMVNNNFFAVYNKYSGVLRFFYYMPKISSGDDHMWEVDMTNMMAQRSVYHYGLPMDLKIADKAALGQDKDNIFVDYVTPYVRQQAQDGKISPNQGWWAFDVDLSLYRPDDKSFADDQSISLQIRSWNESHVSLTSAITGKLEGDMKLDQTKTYTIVSKKKGVFGFIKDAVNIGKTAASAIVSARKGDVKSALTSGISAGKDGYAFYGALKNNKNSSTTVTDTLSRITGTFNASIQADAETDGTISTSKPVTGAASPTIPAKQFITAGIGIGDGVWNLKTSPVVYYFSTGMTVYSPDIYNRNIYNLYFFDPSSVEVALNPEVFPESEIEWAEVTALCGARDEMKQGGTDKYHKAFGLDYSINTTEFDYKFPLRHSGNFDYYWGFDFLYNSDDKFGLTYASNIPWTDKALSGRGIEGKYYIEPCLRDGFPDLEVDVTVAVKLRSMDAPIILSRPYIPAIKRLESSKTAEFAEVYDRIENKLKQNGKIEMSPLCDYQLQRIRGFRNHLDPMFEVVSTQSKGCYDAAKLFANGNYNDDGVPFIKQETDFYTVDCNFEWSYEKPKTPWAYEMSKSIWHWAFYPASWKLKAKLNEGDDWKVIDEQTNNTDWLYKKDEGAGCECTAQFDLKEKNKSYQYYRLEITQKSDWSNNLFAIFKLLY